MLLLTSAARGRHISGLDIYNGRICVGNRESRRRSAAVRGGSTTVYWRRGRCHFFSQAMDWRNIYNSVDRIYHKVLVRGYFFNVLDVIFVFRLIVILRKKWRGLVIMKFGRYMAIWNHFSWWICTVLMGAKFLGNSWCCCTLLLSPQVLLNYYLLLNFSNCWNNWLVIFPIKICFTLNILNIVKSVVVKFTANPFFSWPSFTNVIISDGRPLIIRPNLDHQIFKQDFSLVSNIWKGKSETPLETTQSLNHKRLWTLNVFVD